ncbi:MAG: Npun_F5749 family FMN-dependent PPOX-type flavoprotein [Cyanobacteria bacterium J06638_22]
MDLAPWRSPLARALQRNRSLPEARYFQLATVQQNGRPANRTVVFRGFLDGTNSLQIITDTRSDKVNQLCHNPWAEGCWYFAKTREQFRLAGQLQLIEANETDERLRAIRQQLWHNLSDKARSQFAWDHPGQPRQSEATFVPEIAAETKPLPTFCAVLLHPVHVDHLELRGNPQNRTRYDKHEADWVTLAINP